MSPEQTAIVAGVDFGTLSVRVSIVSSTQGRLGSATADYPLHRRKDDPDYATQSHADQMEALAIAVRNAVAAANVPPHKFKRSPSIPQAPASSP